MLVNLVYGGKLGIKTIRAANIAKYKDNLIVNFTILFMKLKMNPISKCITPGKGK